MTRLTDIVKNRVALATSSGKVSGTLALQDFTVTKGFVLQLYTGSPSTQNIVTGINSVDWTVPSNGSGFWFDRSTKQVKTDVGGVAPPGECLANISKVHTKGRNVNWGNFVFDGLRGVGKWLSTNQTATEGSDTTMLSSFNSDGFTLGSNGNVNNNGNTYIVYQELFTHVKWGTTNGKLYIEAFNPVTGNNMIYYIGDGTTSHNIPHSSGRVLDLQVHKSLSVAGMSWQTTGEGFERLNLAYTNADANDQSLYGFGSTDTEVYMRILSSIDEWNKLDAEYIMYGKVASKVWSIIHYKGTSSAGNFIKTLDSNGDEREPARVTIKKTNGSGSWITFDNKRTLGGVGVARYTLLDSNNAETTNGQIGMVFNTNGFTISGNNVDYNSNDGTYIALVEFDTNSDGGGSYFDLPTDDTDLVLSNAVVTYSDGVEPQGFKLSFASVVSESIDFSTATDGFVYVYRDIAGAYGFDTVEPSFDTEIGYYTGETTAKSYIGKVWVASQTPQYVDYSWNSNKTFVGNLVSDGSIATHGEFIGKNACTAWIAFDGTTTPITIKESYNVKAILKLSNGKYKIYFGTRMDKTTYLVVGSNSQQDAGGANYSFGQFSLSTNLEDSCVMLLQTSSGVNEDKNVLGAYFMGGKN
jgi:hypothetical protein